MYEYRICIDVFLSKNVLHLILHNIYEQWLHQETVYLLLKEEITKYTVSITLEGTIDTFAT